MKNLPEEVQSALVPQGLVEQGSSLHSEKGSPMYPLLHLQTALAPVAEQSALMPHGLCWQGFRLHWTNGSDEIRTL